MKLLSCLLGITLLITSVERAMGAPAESQMATIGANPLSSVSGVVVPELVERLGRSPLENSPVGRRCLG